jgi:predicted CXXCH cytochrome family protein
MSWRPRLRPVDWLFVLGVAVVILFVSLLPSPREKNPMVPGIPAHRGVSEKQCSECHRAGGTYPLTVRHPKRQDCFRCHRHAESQTPAARVEGKEKEPQ